MEKEYRIYSPSLDNLDFKKIFEFYQDAEIQSAINRTNEEYLHWEDLRYKTWVPGQGITKEEFWACVRFSREMGKMKTPIQDKSGGWYGISTSQYAEFLHIIDTEMAGSFMGIPPLEEGDKRHYITRNLIEESIASSQLEGANTSREAAKKMLLSGRQPRDYSERMIVNNHRIMQAIEHSFCHQELTFDLLIEMHRMITHGTLDAERQGVLRETLDEKGKRLVVKPWDSEDIAYVTPDREFVEEQLPVLFAFANDAAIDAPFMHPLIKGILLHFWIGLLHPFEDGNGRLARAVFYWYMLRKNYWAFAYLSLSEKILKSSKQYAMAYIYSEQDDFDLSYFVHYNIKKLKMAREDFQQYIRRKIHENKHFMSSVKCDYALNERQSQLLQAFIQKRLHYTTIAEYKNIHGVSRLTADSDLKKLVQQRLLSFKKIDRVIHYYPTDNLKTLLEKN